MGGVVSSFDSMSSSINNNKQFKKKDNKAAKIDLKKSFLSKFSLENDSDDDYYDDDDSLKSRKSLDEETSSVMTSATSTTFHKELERFREKWNIGTPSSTTSVSRTTSLDIHDDNSTIDSSSNMNYYNTKSSKKKKKVVAPKSKYSSLHKIH